jgi:hypothetical protein
MGVCSRAAGPGVLLTAVPWIRAGCSESLQQCIWQLGRSLIIALACADTRDRMQLLDCIAAACWMDMRTLAEDVGS